MKIFENYRNLGQSGLNFGRVIVDQDECTGCKKCANVCPAKALEMIDKKSQMKDDPECISCGACVAVCGENSIMLVNFYNVPFGAYRTMGRRQMGGPAAYPRRFVSSDET